TSLHLDAGHSYAFVVFGANGDSLGGYQFASHGRPDMIIGDMTTDVFGENLVAFFHEQLSPYLSAEADPSDGLVSFLHEQLSPYLTAPAGSAVDLGTTLSGDGSFAPGYSLELSADAALDFGGTPAIVNQVPQTSPMEVVAQPPVAATELALDALFSSPVWSRSVRTRLF